jgi:hypothetical protein
MDPTSAALISRSLATPSSRYARLLVVRGIA